MENYIYNSFSRSTKYPLFLDLSYGKIKEMVWYLACKQYGNVVGFRFHPKFLQTKMIGDNGVRVAAESFKDIVNVKGTEIGVKDKMVFQSSKGPYVIVDRARVYLNSKNAMYRTLYSPEYLYDVLDNSPLSDVSLSNISFYFESVVDYMESEFKKTGQYIPYTALVGPENKSGFVWPALERADYDAVARYIFDRKTVPDWYSSTDAVSQFSYIGEFMEAYSKYFIPFVRQKIPEYIVSFDYLYIRWTVARGDARNEYINLDRLFRNIPVSSEIPFMALKLTRNSKFKVFKEFKDKKVLRDWTVASEGADTKMADYRGLTFKVLNNDIYTDIILFGNGKIMVQCKQSRSQSVDLDSICTSKVSHIVDAVNKITSAFTNEPGKLVYYPHEHKDRLMRIDLTCQSKLSPEELSVAVRENDFLRNFVLSDVFNRVGAMDNNYITLVSRVAQKNLKLQEKKNMFAEGEPYFDRLAGIEGEYENSTKSGYEMIFRSNVRYENAGLIELVNIDTRARVEMATHWARFIMFLSNKSAVASDMKVNRANALKRVDEYFNSRSCQKARQPVISDTIEPLPGSYAITYKGHRIVCDNPEHPYPGVNARKGFCCFSTDQRGTDKYAERLGEDTNFLIQPSNILFNGNIVFMKSEKLFYVKDGDYKKLPVQASKEIMKKEAEANSRGNTYFLSEVSFNKLLFPPQKKNCPNISQDALGNFVCPDNYTLGVAQNGTPCCFVHEPRKLFPLSVSVPVINMNTSHQISTDKILSPGRIGLINGDAQKLLGAIMPGFRMFRYGVNQTADNFLNAAAFVLRRRTLDIKADIMKKLDQSMFLSLWNGEVASRFENIKMFRAFLTNQSVRKSYEEYWDLLATSEHVNILLIDYDAQSIVCRPRGAIVMSRPVVPILKIKNSYEPVIFTNDRGEIQPVPATVPAIVKDVLSFSCTSVTNIDAKNLRYQIMDRVSKNKVRFLITKDNFYIPVSESMGPIAGVPVRSMSKRKPSAKNIIEKAPSMNVNVTGQVLDDSGMVVGLLTSKMIVIPVRKEKALVNVPIVDYNYIGDADKKFSTKIKEDERVRFLNNKRDIEHMYHSLKHGFSMYSLNTSNPSVRRFVNEHGSVPEDLKQYFIGRLEFDAKNDETISQGLVPKDYVDDDEPYQVVMTHIDQVLEYLEKLD